jgi:diguanylate cyclase (GGDEF)-like protein
MKSRDYKSLPRCTVDYPLEFTTEEAAALAEPINTLLKSTYLLGISKDIEGTFQSLFDIAEEISNADCFAYIAGSQDSDDFEIVSSRHVAPASSDESVFVLPASISRHFNKTVLIDSDCNPHFKSICDAWSCKSLLSFPLRNDRDFMGALVFGKGRTHPFTSAHIKMLWFLSMHAENRLLQGEAVKTLSFYSFLDPLTHLHNRRYFDDQLEKEIFRSRRNGKPFSLLMLDLDGFKAYNDRFLHMAGDIVLQEYSGILREAVREVDTVARLGGDEFSVILEESSAEGARDLATRLADRLGRHLLPGVDNARNERLSASIGIASFPADSFDKQDLIQKADRALYMAKSQGGGKVCLYHEIAELLTVKPSPTDLPIHKIYEAARSVVDMDKFLEILLFTAMQGLSASRGSIVVLDPQGNHTLRTAIGFSNGEERFTRGIPIPQGSVTTWVLEHGKPLVVSTPGDMPVHRQMKKNGYRSDSFLSVPLIHEGRRIGAIHLTNRRDKKPFSHDDVAAFAPIAEEIGTVLHQGLTFRESVKQFSASILHSLTNAMEMRFSFLSGHSSRVADLAFRVGRKLGLGNEELDVIRTAAGLHDIGLVGIPGSLLFKKQRLTEKEMEIVRKHAFLGSKLLEGVPGMEETRRIILEHHEHFDGSGYPYGLQGEEISLGARILSVAEFYDSVTSERPHRGKLLPHEAIQLVKNNTNTLFEGQICRAFVEEVQNPDTSGPAGHSH